jgi:hypothetical protein
MVGRTRKVERNERMVQITEDEEKKENSVGTCLWNVTLHRALRKKGRGPGTKENV